MSQAITKEEATLDTILEMSERMQRVDTLLSLLFEGLVAHPLATTMIPPDQLEQLRKILNK